MKLFRNLSIVALWCSLSFYAPANAHEEYNKHHDGEVHIAMTAAFVSENGVDIYKDIADYLSAKVGIKMDMISGLSYETVDHMLKDGAVQVAFVCGYPYVLTKKRPGSAVNLLAAPVMADESYGGKPVYFSYIIVKTDSKATSFKDLRGQRFVYNEETSNSGYNMPRARLIEMNETKGFFGIIERSGSHEESIRMVAEGKADASAIDSLVFDYARLTRQPYIEKVKIIDKLGPASIPPVVYSSKLSPELVKRIQSALLDMDKDAAGQAILKRAYLKHFIPVDDAGYNDVRRMHDMATSANYMTIK